MLSRLSYLSAYIMHTRAVLGLGVTRELFSSREGRGVRKDIVVGAMCTSLRRHSRQESFFLRRVMVLSQLKDRWWVEVDEGEMRPWRLEIEAEEAKQKARTSHRAPCLFTKHCPSPPRWAPSVSRPPFLIFITIFSYFFKRHVLDALNARYRFSRDPTTRSSCLATSQVAWAQ